MNEAKPFIFIEPLSSTLLKLKEIVEETALEEGVEIFVIEDILEANQLIPSIGQGLIVCSNAKKCAAILQANRRYISHFNSKVLLLNPRPIPRKTLEKFMKVGLTECIVEPVPPKTLLYKAKLLLRSIGTRKAQEDLEMRSFKSEEESESDQNSKQRIEKGILPDEADSSSSSNKSKNVELTFYEEEKATKKNNTQEIESHWSGHFESNADNSYDKNLHAQSSYTEGSMATHYRGELNHQGPSLNEESKAKKMASHSEEDVHEKEKGQEIEINYEEIKAKLREMSHIEDSKRPASGLLNEEISTHYKGKITNSSTDEKEAQALTPPDDFEIDFGASNKKVEIEIEEQQDESPQVLKKTESDEDTDTPERDPLLEIDKSEERKKGQEIDLLLDAEDDERQKEEALPKKAPHGGKVDHLEKFLKSRVRAQADDLEEEIDLLPLKKEASAKEESERPQHAPIEDEKSPDKANATELDLVTRPTKSKKLQAEAEEEDSEGPPTNSPPSSPGEDTPVSRERPELEKATSEDKAPLDLKLEDATAQKRKSEAQELDNYMRSRVEGASAQRTSRERPHTDNRAQNIETHYKSSQGLKEQDNDWSDKFKRESTPDEESSPQEERTLQFLTPEKQEEQTIDYRRLKEQFEAISSDSSGRFKVIEGMKTSAKKKEETGPRNSSDAPCEKETEVLGEVFHPIPAGLDFVIAYAERLSNQALEERDHFEYVASYLQEEYQALCIFYVRKAQTNSYDLSYQSPELAAPFDLESFIAKNRETWSLMSLPYWLDHTFQTKDQYFFFPFNEGTQKIGHAVIKFSHLINEEQTAAIEVIVESLRGLYLQLYHSTGLEGNYHQDRRTSAKKVDKKLISKLKFWKKAS